MLAEKFFLMLETIRSRVAEDAPRPIISTAPHIPIKAEPPRRALSVLIESEPRL